MDRWWTPTTNSQAEDRLHRIGQQNKVQVIIPVTDKSIDLSLDTILRKKASFSQEFFDEKDIMQETIEDMRKQRSDILDNPEDEEEDSGDPDDS
jgi:SNF2 family DNA or RNA helicase